MRQKRYSFADKESWVVKSLKEWTSVIRALQSGDQTVLLRKGGILETASGFRLESERFLLFPTAEHQGHANIKEEFHHTLQATDSSDHTMITSYAEVLAHADILSEQTIDKLSGFHIWSKSYIDGRRAWMSDKPIKAMFLKVYKIPEISISQRPEYKGCKSWIDIEKETPEGTPVLSDASLETRLREFKEIVN